MASESTSTNQPHLPPDPRFGSIAVNQPNYALPPQLPPHPQLIRNSHPTNNGTAPSENNWRPNLHPPPNVPPPFSVPPPNWPLRPPPHNQPPPPFMPPGYPPPPWANMQQPPPPLPTPPWQPESLPPPPVNVPPDNSKIDNQKPTSDISESRENQATADQTWVQNFVGGMSLVKSSAKTVKDGITICEARRLLQEAVELKNELQTLLEAAKSGSEDRDMHKKFDKAKTRLSEIQRTLSDENNLKSLETRIARARKKRMRQRRGVETRRKEQELIRESHKEAGERIDEWQRSLTQKMMEAKQAAELKKSADNILAEVRRKKTEARRSHDLLRALTKLREIRKEKARSRGLYTESSRDEALYSERLKAAEELWDRQLQTYDEEQRVLEVMMEVEQEETKVKEREKTAQREDRKLRELRRQIKLSLFGDSAEPSPDDPLFSYKQYYDSANHSVENLIQIRHEWDCYIEHAEGPEGSSFTWGTPEHGTSLPASWVIPCPPSSDTWASVCSDNTKR